MLCQGIVTATYITIGCEMDCWYGSYASDASAPAQGSTRPTMEKVIYGIALPSLIVTTTLVIHVNLARAYRTLYPYADAITACMNTQISIRVKFVRVL